MQLVIEKKLEEKLASELGEDRGRERYAHYTIAKEPLQDALDEIKKKYPEFTGHDIGHVNGVLEKAYLLLGKSIDLLNCEELYLLMMAILFHDSGMIVSRTDHQNKIDFVFDTIRGIDARIRPEKKLVKRIIRAHSGTGLDGTSDTLKDVEVLSSFEGKGIKLRELSAILRFADELEEDARRASNFAVANKSISADSIKYHEYSRGIKVHIDDIAGRIALDYNISVYPGADAESAITFLFERIAKLDNERRYAKYYSNILSPFKETQVCVDFWGEHNEELEQFSEKFVLDDKVLPSNACGNDLTAIKDAIIAKIKIYCPPNSKC